MESDILKRVTKRIPIDIEFYDLQYRVGKKLLLNSICGKFQHGQLTAILGSSGSGKTTLLSVLAGHIQSDVSGNILINGKPRNMKSFRRISCYLMQDDALRNLLTVTEAITLSANLRLGKDFSPNDKILVVKEITKIMGLEKCCDTRVEHLSGGERKRLAIALEIISNPPVLFLDEPTSGLDYAMAKNFVQFLKSMAQDGRTIVCTIHQPSDSMFQVFDQVYFLSHGYCIYNGDFDGIVPFLSNANITCPTSYSPFDYIIELAQFNEEYTIILKDIAENGQADMQKQINPQISYVNEESLFINEFPVSFLEQIRTLTCRSFIQMKRNKTFWAICLIPSIVIGLLKGFLFWGVGNDGAKLMENLRLILSFSFFYLFQQTFSEAIIFPFEMKIFQREYANRWYSLNAYYVSLSLTTLPFAILSSLIFIIPLYFMTDQPLEIYRFINVLVVSILVGVTSQALGQALGCLVRPMIGAVVGSIVTGTVAIMIVYGFGEVSDINILRRIFMEINFVRHGFTAFCISILKDRDLLRCDEIFCYLRDTDIVLKLFGFEERKFYESVTYLFVFFLIHKFCLYIFLRFRVSSTFNVKVLKYMEFAENKISGG